MHLPSSLLSTRFPFLRSLFSLSFLLCGAGDDMTLLRLMVCIDSGTSPYPSYKQRHRVQFCDAIHSGDQNSAAFLKTIFWKGKTLNLITLEMKAG